MKPYACRPNVRTRFQSPASQFNPFNHHWQEANSKDLKVTRPAANIIRRESGYEIQLAVPGISKDQIKLQVIEGQLIISANTSSHDTTPTFVRHEFDYTNFKRSFNLQQNADTDNLKASFDQGILSIVIPTKEPQVRKIEIQ